MQTIVLPTLKITWKMSGSGPDMARLPLDHQCFLEDLLPERLHGHCTGENPPRGAAGATMIDHGKPGDHRSWDLERFGGLQI